jgi:drug/metabolite transporter (DMT)-like permease
LVSEGAACDTTKSSAQTDFTEDLKKITVPVLRRGSFSFADVVPMNPAKGIAFKLISAGLFAVMSALIRHLGARYPVGQVVFYRSVFAIIPVVSLSTLGAANSQR